MPSPLDRNHPANIREGNSRNRSYTYLASIPKPIFSLGWELEANHQAARVPNGVETISDGSVNGDGTEYIVLPSVTRSPRYVLNLLKDLVHAPKLNTDKSCGFHVHMSIQNATIPKLQAWAIATETLARDIETAAMKAVPEARHGNSYCRMIKETKAGQQFQASKYGNDRRYNWLNTVEIFRPGGIRTVEVRLLGNTHRWKYLLSWSTFCLLLAREGWNVAHKPFEDRTKSVGFLMDVLSAIETEIRPLEKKHEPIPAWVYSNLKNLGIDFTAFDRPLTNLANVEYALKGMSKRFYSDNQESLPNESDDEDNQCSCGCGESERCSYQQHEDGDCDSSYCAECHNNGDCSGLRRGCELCVMSAHDNNEYCQDDSCRDCRRNHRGPHEIVEETDEPSVSVSNVTIHPSNVMARSGSTTWFSAVVHPDTLQSVETEINAIHNATVDSANIVLNSVVHDAMIYGEGIARTVWYDDSVNVGTGVPAGLLFDRPLDEMRGHSMMTDDEQTMSLDRHSFYEYTTSRGERANAMMTPLERDASMERSEMRTGCDDNCGHDHTTECLMCGQHWLSHCDHTCPNSGTRGSFPTGGR